VPPGGGVTTVYAPAQPQEEIYLQTPPRKEGVDGIDIFIEAAKPVGGLEEGGG
jgi:hypothetical protein